MKVLDMMTSEDIERIKEDSSYQTLLEMWREEKKKRQEAEGEVTIVKGIGQNSPEVKALRKEIEELKAALARAKEEHQYDNLVHAEELRKALNK
jgi:DNA polymerase elongation subunit (family B)